MRSLLFRMDAERENALLADIWECGTYGIVEESEGIWAYFDESVALDDLLARYSDLIEEDGTTKEPEAVRISQDGWDPVLVGERFFIVPPWLDEPAPPGRMRLTVDSSRAFGTGRHETTQLMIEALEQTLGMGQSVVDVGCGSGILSTAASMLGAGQVFSCDVDPVAIEEARKLVTTPLFVGSAGAMQDSIADVVIANITRPVLEALAADLWRIVKPGGTVIVAGFLATDTPAGFKPSKIWERADWQCWMCLDGDQGTSTILPM